MRKIIKKDLTPQGKNAKQLAEEMSVKELILVALEQGAASNDEYEQLLLPWLKALGLENQEEKYRQMLPKPRYSTNSQ